MLDKKSYFCMMLMFCFFVSSPFFNLQAEEGVEKADQQKTEGQGKSTFTIKGSKISVILDEKAEKQKAGETHAIKIENSKIGIVTDKKPSEKKKAESKKKQVTEGKKPHITFDTMEYDVGEVWEGAVISHDFTVKNTGDAVLKINKVKPG